MNIHELEPGFAIRDPLINSVRSAPESLRVAGKERGEKFAHCK